MMTKIALVVLALAVLSTTYANKLPTVCTYEDLGDGAKLENCTGKDAVVWRNGTIEQTIVFQNNTLEIIQYPNSSDCYAVHDVDIPEGFSGELEKDQCREDANEDISNKVKSLAPAKCTGAVYIIKDCPMETEAASRHKRACGFLVHCIYNRREFRVYTVRVRQHSIRCKVIGIVCSRE